MIRFAIYVEEKLCFNKHQRNITEKRINVLLETEMSVENESIDQSIQPFQIFKILQSVRIITLWQMYLTVSSMENVPTQEILSFVWIFLITPSDEI